MATYLELQDQIKKLTEEAEKVRQQEVTQVFDQIKSLMEQAGLTIEDLRTHFGQKEKADTSIVKYRGPSGETWSGRGRNPKWLTALETAGHNRNEYLIE